jgi:hypothetical protein
MRRVMSLLVMLVRPGIGLLLGYGVGLTLIATIVGYVLLIQLKPGVDATTFALRTDQQVQAVAGAGAGGPAADVAGFPDMTVQPLLPGVQAEPGADVPLASLDLSQGANVTGVLLAPAAGDGVVARFGPRVASGDDACQGVWLDDNAAQIAGVGPGDVVAVSFPAGPEGPPKAVRVCGGLDAYADPANPQPQHGLAVVRDPVVWQTWGAPAQDQAPLTLVDAHGPASAPPWQALAAMGGPRLLVIAGAGLFGVAGWLLLTVRMTSAFLDRTADTRALLRWWPVSTRELRLAVLAPVVGVTAVSAALAAWLAGRPALLVSLRAGASLEAIIVLALLLVAVAVPLVALTVHRRFIADARS